MKIDKETAARSARSAAESAAESAAWSARRAAWETKHVILNYGLTLLQVKP